MRNRLLSIRKYNISRIDIIQNQKKNCNACADGKIKTYIKKFNINITHACNCNFADNRTMHEYDILNRRLEKTLYYINHEVPEECRNYINLHNYLECKDFFNNKKVILWIAGGLGVGKTTILHAFDVEGILQNKDFRLVKETKIDYSYGQVIPPFRNDTFFGIDDVSTNGKLEKYYQDLIDDKRINRTKLIITSNFTPAEWVANFKDSYIGKRIIDRMKGILMLVEISGASKRYDN